MALKTEQPVLSQDPAGEKDFCQLYEQHVAQIYRCHFVRTGCAAEAEELTAETFYAALVSFDHYHSQGSAAPWLVGIARHKLADHFRRRLFRGKPRTVPLMMYSAWVAGNGEIEGDWIRRKELIVGVIKESNVYHLRLIGTGP
jgi:DNA-directed RNA polymerase specialized sigma24 family protein